MCAFFITVASRECNSIQKLRHGNQFIQVITLGTSEPYIVTSHSHEHLYRGRMDDWKHYVPWKWRTAFGVTGVWMKLRERSPFKPFPHMPTAISSPISHMWSNSSLSNFWQLFAGTISNRNSSFSNKVVISQIVLCVYKIWNIFTGFEPATLLLDVIFYLFYKGQITK